MSIKTCVLELLVVSCNVVEVQVAKLNFSILGSCLLTCITAEYDNVEEGVTHESVCTVDTACCLTCYEEVRDSLCEAVAVDLNTAVLVVECRIDEDRNLSHIDAVVHVHTEHGRDSLLDCSLTAEDLDHRCVEPYTLKAARDINTSSLSALTDNAGSVNVTSLERMDVSLTVGINELGTYGSYLLCNESAEDL